MDGEDSADFSSVGFDPNAADFVAVDSSQDVSVNSSLPSLNASSSQGGSSLVFGGGGDFLSKYQQRSQRGRDYSHDMSGSSDAPSFSGSRDECFQGAGSMSGGSGPRGPRQRRGGSTGGSGSRDYNGSMESSRGSGPAPDRQNIQLNSMLVHGRTVDKILQVVDAHFSHFNAVNMITALHRLATVVVAARKGALRRDVRFKRLIHRLSDTLRNADAGALKPQDLSNVAWALTKLGLLNAKLFDNLSEHILRTIQQFEPVNLSMTLWAFARSGFLDDKLFRASAAEVKRQLQDFQPQQIANTTWAMAKSGFVDEELFTCAAELALKKLGEFQPMNYSMLLYSFALAKLPHPKLFEEVGKRCTVQALSSAMSAPHVVTNLALAFSEAGVVNPQVFDTIAKVATNSLQDFRTQQIATLAQAFTRAKVKQEKFIVAINKAMEQGSTEFKQEEYQEMMESYRKLGQSTAQLHSAMETRQKESTDDNTNFWSLLTAIAFILLVTLIAWRMRTAMASAALVANSTSP